MPGLLKKVESIEFVQPVQFHPKPTRYSSGNPMTTPPDTIAKLGKNLIGGIGWRVISSRISDNPAATIALPKPTKIGSNPVTAILVAGKVRLNISMPKNP